MTPTHKFSDGAYAFSNRFAQEAGSVQLRPENLPNMTERGHQLLVALGDRATTPTVVQTAQQLQGA